MSGIPWSGGPGDSSAHDAVTIYTMGDERFFVGTVALLNSLRLTGHRYELVVLDLGFTPTQRAQLLAHCTLVDKPPFTASNLHLLKPFPSLLNPMGTVVIIDSDIIVTRSLEEILTLARHGKICAYPDPTKGYWQAEWQQLFQLRAPLRRQAYLNSGFVAFSAHHWPDLLGRWWEACQLLAQRPMAGKRPLDGLPAASDQDALNALLMSEVAPEDQVVLPIEEAPAAAALVLRGVQLVDARSLACRHRGHATVLLHQANSPKPWQPRGWIVARRNPYTRLLQRLALGRDAALQLAETDLPLWLRPDPLGRTALRALDLVNAPTFQRAMLRMLPNRLVEYLQQRRR